MVLLVFLFIIKDDETAGGTLLEAAPDENQEFSESNPVNETTSEQVLVDIKGAVANPGVYELIHNARIHDAIQMAGGFLDDADQSSVNLAQKVQDEMIINVPREGDENQKLAINDQAGDKVRINYASQEEIQTLNGIGPSKAQAIIAHRDEHGFFKTIEDLLEVSGIGEKTLENIRDAIQVP